MAASAAFPAPVIRIAGADDALAVAELRRAWTIENHGEIADEGYTERFLDWYAHESDRRVTWVAEVGVELVGMVNMAVFDRMPQPGSAPRSWGYLANAFVLAAHRNQGIGSLLLTALLEHADTHGFARVVLNPSTRSIPFYRRAGFTSEHGLLVRPGAAS